MMKLTPSTQWIRNQRPSRPRPEPSQPWGFSWERERDVQGETRPNLTLFLTGAECPFTCVFCDLWQYTHSRKTESGSIPDQIRELLDQAGEIPKGTTLKLYNASNFFDQRSVPREDDLTIAQLVSAFHRVTVESHPHFVDERCFRFAEALPGQLEVALGLETVHPEAFSRLNKGTTLNQLEGTVGRLRDHDIAVRLFVQISPPFVPAHCAVDWAVRSVARSFELGAQHVSLIPTRGGNGALDALQEREDFAPTTLSQLEEALERSLLISGAGVVTADLWDLTTTHAHETRLLERLGRLQEINGPDSPPAPRSHCEAVTGDPTLREARSVSGLLAVTIVGSGFAGSILARVLQSQGHSVTLLERQRHPRFALGESSTPLAAIALERLAQRFNLPDLHHLATYERWSKHHPTLRRGLKRGFTFLDATANPNSATSASLDRLLVAASPANRCADAHWMRCDVDHYMIKRARSEGVRVLESIELDAPEVPREGQPWLWNGSTPQGKVHGTSDLLVDGTGPGGWLAKVIAPNDNPPTTLSTQLLAAHFAGVEPLSVCQADPYPAGRAAVHHLLDCGWLYELRFDNGLTSAGLVIDRRRLEDSSPWNSEGSSREPSLNDSLWKAALSANPDLQRRFGQASRKTAWSTSPRLQRQAATAAGSTWALLPSTYAFWSPLFSTGIAWSLLGVERIGELLDPAGSLGPGDGLERYGQLLASESNFLRRLTEAAYSTLSNLDAFHGVALIYFAAASYSEARQRSKDRYSATDSWAWSPFLGSADREILSTLEWVEEQLVLSAEPSPSQWVPLIRQRLAARDVVGLDSPIAPGVYAANLDVFLRRLGRLGLTPEEQHRASTRLRC